MDGHRFDDLTRSLAGLSRRRLLAGLTGALLGGAASQLDERGANAACPSRQVYRQRVPSGGGCVCVATGRPPTNRAGTCPCPGGNRLRRHLRRPVQQPAALRRLRQSLPPPRSLLDRDVRRRRLHDRGDRPRLPGQ